MRAGLAGDLAVVDRAHAVEEAIRHYSVAGQSKKLAQTDRVASSPAGLTQMSQPPRHLPNRSSTVPCELNESPNASDGGAPHPTKVRARPARPTVIQRFT
jgi:hypothetical protein